MLRVLAADDVDVAFPPHALSGAGGQLLDALCKGGLRGRGLDRQEGRGGDAGVKYLTPVTQLLDRAPHLHAADLLMLVLVLVML